MSEIISSPLIFSTQEVKDRFQMHRFIHKIFKPCKAGQGDLIGLPAEDLYHVFKIQYPMNVLTAAITSNMLLTGGFIDEENPEQSVLYAYINESQFINLKKEAQLSLLPFVKNPMAIRFRQLLIGIRVMNKDNTLGIKPEFAIKNFVNMFTFNPSNMGDNLRNLTVEQRSAVTDIYNYYRLICYIYGWPSTDRKLFQSVLADLGYIPTKGRVYGKAGMRFYRYLYIPQKIEDRVLSVELNMCCIHNGTTHWTIRGVLENFIEAQRAELCDSNLERMGFDEQERKAIQEKKSQINIRGTFETGEIPLGQTTPPNETKDDLGYHSGSSKEHEQSEVTDSDNIPDEDISRTNGFNAESEAQFSRNDGDYYDDPLELGETYRDRYARLITESTDKVADVLESGTDDNELGEDTGESNTPSIEEIASALTVPYAMSVAAGFTKEIMLGWLQKMDIPEPEAILEHYDEIMEILSVK